MTLTLIVENFISGMHATTSFTDADFKTVEKNWERSDTLLKQINEQGYFDGRSTWSELLPEHWYFLATQNLEKVLVLDRKKQLDPRNKTVESFHFLIMGTVKCIEEQTNQNIDLIRIQVLRDLTYNFQIHSSFMMNFKTPHKLSSISKPELSIIVDNTENG